MSASRHVVWRNGTEKCPAGSRSVLVFLFCMLSVSTVSAQNRRSFDLLQYYTQIRTSKIASDRTRFESGRLTQLPLDPLGTMADSINSWVEEIQTRRLLDSLPEPQERFVISSWELISETQSSLHESRFQNVEWSFTGSSSRSPLDTMRTADLRSRMQFHFGPPTRTLTEAGYPDSLRAEDIIEFEYWFVLNDSIPVVILDVNGPWDRGIILAADKNFRSELEIIKLSFLGQLVMEDEREPFTDYYFNHEQQNWYLAGFDGASFFNTRIQRPDLSLGRPAPDIHKIPDTENQ